MKIINIPQDILPGKNYKPENIIIYDYSASNYSFKRKSILNKNTISLVISGEKTMHFAEKSISIKNDEFHFLSAGNCLASVSFSNQEIFRSILIFFDNKTLTDFYIKHAKLINLVKGKDKIKSEPYLAFKKDAFINNYILSLDLLFHSGKSISAEMKLLKFEELLLHLLEKYPEKILSFQPAQKKDINDLEIRKAIETNITNNLSLEELAFLCNTSISTFKRRFIKIYGTSPSKWILQKRMDMAKHLLLYHNERPSEVYHKVGYENHSSFSQSFKQTFGITPREFQSQRLTFNQ